MSIGVSIVKSVLWLWLVSLATLAASAHAAVTPVILVFGDSLSAAYGLAKYTGWVDLLEQRLRTKQFPHIVINASISGETTSGGAARFPDALRARRADIVILELGANDGLRGLPISALRSNLQAMISACKDTGARVILVGIRLPTNYGKAYTEKFQRAFSDLASANRIAFVPSLLDGIETRRELFQSDNVHPTAEAQTIILDNVWRVLAPKLREKMP